MTALTQQPSIVFDLDGTFLDTAPDLLSSLNHVLSEAKLDAANPDQMRIYVGHGGREMIRRAFEARNAPLPEALHDELVESFLAHYTAEIPGQSSAFQGAVKCVEAFRAAGWKTAICTNKYQRLAVPLLEGLKLDHLFDAICGSDVFPMRKPDPRHLTMTIESIGGDVSKAVMVGDSDTDIKTAQAANIPVIAVSFGYTPEHVSTFNPTKVIDHFDELTLELASDLLA